MHEIFQDYQVSMEYKKLFGTKLVGFSPCPSFIAGIETAIHLLDCILQGRDAPGQSRMVLQVIANDFSPHKMRLDFTKYSGFYSSN